jgi:uncharacterized protein
VGSIVRVRALVVVIVLVLVGAGCSSSAKKSAARAGGFGITGLNPTGPIGVVALGSAKQKVRADLAFVVIAEGGGLFGAITGLQGPGELPSFPPATTAATAGNDHASIRAALRPLGIATAAIQFSRPDASGNSGDLQDETVQVEVPVAELPKIATAVVAAITKVGVSVATQGLRFAVADCVAALSTARDQAFADARKHAQALATAAGVTLGDVTSVSEQPVQASPLSYLTAGQTPCGRGSVTEVSGIEGLSLSALSAKPEVELTESVSASYALDATDARTIAAVGEGEVSGPADAADIVIAPSTDIEFPTSAASTKIDGARVLKALAPLGIAKKDVEVENPTTVSAFPPDEAASYVSVHVTAARVKTIGAKIVRAVQTVVGAGGTTGVIFSASNCEALLAQARAKAAADGGKRIDKLAAAAKVKAGPIVGVSEAATNILFSGLFPSVDPCDTDLDSVEGLGLLSALQSGSGPGVPTLAALDAEPAVTERVSLGINRALTS